MATAIEKVEMRGRGMIPRAGGWVILPFGLILWAVPVLAQPLAMEPSAFSSVPDFSPPAAVEPDAGRNFMVPGIAGALLGLGAGAVAGGIFRAAVRDRCDALCAFGGAMTGAFFGEAVGLAMGVHLANDRRGSLAAGSLISMATLAAGLYLTSRLPSDGARAPAVLVIPITQLALVVRWECRAVAAEC